MATLEQARARAERRAYEAGRAGRAFSVDMDAPVPVDELQAIYDNAREERQAELEAPEPVPDTVPATAPDRTGGAPAAGPAPARGGAPGPARARRPSSRRSRRGTLARPSAPHMVNDGAGFVLGIAAYALFINFVRGGRTQARAWMAAKFLNRPMGTTPSGATAPPRGTAPAAPPATPSTSGGGLSGGLIGGGGAPAARPPAATPGGGLSGGLIGGHA